MNMDALVKNGLLVQFKCPLRSKGFGHWVLAMRRDFTNVLWLFSLVGMFLLEAEPGFVTPIAQGYPRPAFRSATTVSAVLSPTYLSDSDAQRFSEAGYSERSAVYGTASEKMAKEELWTAVQGILGQSSVESFLHSASFVDLGSGEGELVLTALSLFPDLSKGIGVELSEERQDAALNNAQAASPEIGRRAEFIQGDMCDESNHQVMEAIATARLLFISNVMFEKKLMDCISRVIGKFVARNQAAVVVAVGKQLDIDERVTSSHSGLMTGSWGLAPAYIYGILPESR